MSKNPFSKEKGFTEKGLRSKLFFQKKFDQKKHVPLISLNFHYKL